MLLNQKFSMIVVTLILLLGSVLPLSGKLAVQKRASTTIHSGFKRPEGVAFSPSGNCLVVACSSEDLIALYKRIGNSGADYETVPSCVIQHHQLLRHVHDVDFSPCGLYVAAASRESNRVVLYQMDDMEACTLHHKPRCILKSSAIDSPASLAFSPCSQILAVCNRKGGSGITFYRQLKHKQGAYSHNPFLEITEDKLLEYGLSAPHGMAFSPDGNSFAVVHKRYTADAKGKSALAIFERTEDPVTGVSFFPSWIDFLAFSGLHSIDFHPSSRHLAITDGGFTVKIYSLNQRTGRYAHSFDIPVKISKKRSEGAKGVAFSSDGKCLAVTTMEPSVLIYEVEED